MKLSIFIHLPSTLLVACLALTATSLPVDSIELNALTPDNFEQTISEGVWFIEHFSPYCGHCRNFAPTWQQLVESVQNQADPGIHLAQVNCAVHGDLCTQHDVTGYPQMNLYRDGKFVETYKQSRSYDLLNDYLSKHAEPTILSSPVTEPTAAPVLQVNAPPEYRDAPKAKERNPKGAVLALNDETFREAVEEGGVFVKFFAPWCGHCKKLAPTWTQLAGQMQHKLSIAEVNCEDHSSLCGAEDINGFPTLVYYAGKGGGKTEYTSGRKLEQLKAFAEKVSGPAVQQLQYEDFSSRLADHPVFYLLLHSPTDARTVNDVLEASQVLFGSPPIYTSTSALLYEQFSVQPDSAVMLALKDHDPAPSSVFDLFPISKAVDKDALIDWLLRNRLPSAMQLDSDTFQEVMNAPHKPLVVLVAAPKEQMESVAASVKKTARQWRDAKGDAGVTFTWMDADKWGSWLKSMYGLRVDASPRVVVANHSRLVYYDVDQFGEQIQLTPSSIFSAINGAKSATIPYKHSENVVERMARYLNGGLAAAEVYVMTYPWYTTSFVVLGVVLVFLVARRLLSDQYDPRENGMRKSDRLD